MTQHVLDIQAKIPIDSVIETKLRETVAAVLVHEHVTKESSLTILLTDDKEMQQLNRDYAALDEPTDVLSFSVEGAGILPEELDGYLGDIAISMIKAESQAEKGGHSLTAELQLLTIHGVLHLLGYDHDDNEEKAAMWAVQEAILDSLGVDVSIPTD